MIRTAENITSDMLRLQALLEVMEIATNEQEGQREKGKLIYWGGLFYLAKELVDKTLGNAADLEDYLHKQKQETVHE